jgi:hypothetical protein
MSAYILVTDHPYAATTDEKGTFTLGEIPAGKYTLKAWHETLGELTQEVEVSKGDTVEVTFTYPRSDDGESKESE